MGTLMTGEGGPLVSVIMSVYNGATDVPRAVESILTQTYRNLELIAIDNGSFADDTRSVLRGIADKGDVRLRLIELDNNIGLAGALNHGVALARGELIARQDHDDISRSDRLEKQVKFMEAHPSCGLLGTRAEIWVGDVPTERVHDHPLSNAELRVALLANNPFVHSSVMFRRKMVEQVGGYTTDPMRQPPEDFELWSRIARVSAIANLPERLLIYREVNKSMSRDGSNPFLDKLILICSENIAFAIGLSEPDQTCTDAAALLHGAYNRVSRDCDIDTIVSYFERAVENISMQNGGVNLADLAVPYTTNLRHHFGLARKVPDWMRPFVSIARTVPLPRFISKVARSWISR